MDIFVKIVLVGALFATLITAAIWAQWKFEEYKEYWEKDKDGRQSSIKIYGKNLRSHD